MRLFPPAEIRPSIASSESAGLNGSILTAGNHITVNTASRATTVDWKPSWRRMSMLYSDMNSAADWTNYSGGTGVSNSFLVAGLTDGNRLGVLQSGTGTTNVGYAGIGSANTTEVIFGTRSMRMTAVVQVPTLSTSAETFYAIIGFHDRRAQVTPTDGLYFYYTDSATGATWQTIAYSNSVTAGATNTGIVADTSFHTFMIEVSSAGSRADFYIDGTLVSTETSNIPTGSARSTGVGAHIIKSNGTTARLLNIDLLALEMDCQR